MGQIRQTVAIGGDKAIVIPHGLDFAAVLAYANAMGAMSPLLVELLPEIEAIIVRAGNREDE